MRMKRIDLTGTKNSDWLKEKRISNYLKKWKRNNKDSYDLTFPGFEFEIPVQPEQLIKLFDSKILKRLLKKMSRMNGGGSEIVFVCQNPVIGMVYNPSNKEDKQFYLHTDIESIIYRHELV